MIIWHQIWNTLLQNYTISDHLLSIYWIGWCWKTNMTFLLHITLQCCYDWKGNLKWSKRNAVLASKCRSLKEVSFSGVITVMMIAYLLHMNIMITYCHQDRWGYDFVWLSWSVFVMIKWIVYFQIVWNVLLNTKGMSLQALNFKEN